MSSDRLVELAERLEEWSRGCQPESPLIITASLVQNIAAELRAMAGEDDEMDAWRVQAVDELRELHLALATAIAERDAARAACEAITEAFNEREELFSGCRGRADWFQSALEQIRDATHKSAVVLRGAADRALSRYPRAALASVGGEAGGGGG